MVEACGSSVVVVCTDGSCWGCGSGLTNGLGEDNRCSVLRRIPQLQHVCCLALGSLHGGAVDKIGRVWVWGDGLSGQLGMGRKVRRVKHPRQLDADAFGGHCAVSIACTRGQPAPKRTGRKSGQEGPRMHVVTQDGGLWICGTTHKGLGANHLHKTFMPQADLLTPYRVGGKAADARARSAVPTGAAEDLCSRPDFGAEGMGLTSAADFGRQGATHYLDTACVVMSQPCHIHSMALSQDGRLFSWGCGSNGRTGLDAFMRGPGGSKRRLKCYVSTPTAIEEFRRPGHNRHSVAFATCGRYWSFAIVHDTP